MQQFFEFFIKHWDLFLLLAVIVGMLIWQSFAARLRGYQESDPQLAVQLINHQEAMVLDVREDGEYREGHIIDSLHIPLGQLNGKLESLAPYKSKPVIVGCRSGARSAHACGMLRKQGFEQVYNLRGGVMAWQNAGLPLEKDGKRKKK